MSPYFDINDTLKEITDKYPETLPIFISRGFSQMADESMRKTFGATISLKTALSLKKINIDTFSTALEDRIKQESSIADISMKSTRNNHQNEENTLAGAIRVEGLLPCPVRLPLMEKFQIFINQFKESGKGEIQHELKAASMGLDWLKVFVEKLDDPSRLPDILISAGFDLFFEEKHMGKFKRQNVFIDSTGFSRLNSMFDNDMFSLKDPAGHYSMIGVVPAILVVNTTELNGRAIPKSWKDLLEPEYENSVSLPIADFDLFNAILLHLFKSYGPDAVQKLGRSLMESLHPSQMVKSNTRKTGKPLVTVMPYFFTKMLKEGGTMQAVWPDDGAIISPIFMLTKRERVKILQPVIDFFASKEIGEILSYKGLAPSIHPDVNNPVPPGKTFMWLGWDYIYSNDIGKLAEKCKELFNQGAAS